jgi:hypothetical protein
VSTSFQPLAGMSVGVSALRPRSPSVSATHWAAPTDIPAKGWKDVLTRVYLEFQKDRVLSVAAGVTLR